MAAKKTDAPAAAERRQQSAKMLLDSPAANPALGFGEIAGAFASIIETSEPRFAIGIFGDWGSGKTTLMDAIEACLSDETTISVRFNAWRYEREPELLIPLLDTIRQSLLDWSQQHTSSARSGKARTAARRIGRVVRAFVAGAAVEVGVSAAVKVKYDASKAVDQLRADAAADAAADADEQPQSLYFAGFKQLSEALEEFGEDNITRIVVFVDDLDRCLPSNALEVLEAMKLFFDLPGFVFVVGLDEDIVERAVHSRFGDATTVADGVSPAASTEATRRTGAEYVKKLFQVPYALPPMLAQQLDDLLHAMFDEAELGPAQLEDLQSRVRRYLEHVAREGRINPREVKRFVNAYTLQTLVRPQLDRDVVLALQTIVFRADWEVAYDLILTDSALFKEAISSQRQGDAHALDAIWPRGSAVPVDFVAFATSPEGRPLADAADLEPYVFSLQSTRSAQFWLVDAYQSLGSMRRSLSQIRRLPDRLAPGAENLRGEVLERVSVLESILAPVLDSETGVVLRGRLEAIREAVSDLEGPQPSTVAPAPEPPDRIAQIADALEEALTRLQGDIRILRRRAAPVAVA